MKPEVLNKRNDIIPEDAIYVGRPSKWGNPFIIGKDGTREEVVAKYRKMLVDDLGRNQALTFDDIFFTELRGKDLVCWCAPFPCHADILLEFANAEEFNLHTNQ